MAQLDRVLRSYGDKPKSAPSSPTLEHLFRGGESSKWSPTSSPSFGNHLDYEDDHSHHHKKPSVLTKMKERAKKLRHSLSRKKQSEDGNSTPSWGVSLDDDEDLEEDAEYLGAPMYESELAPQEYKETARHHPRSFHVVSEKHVLASSVNRGDEADKENPISIPNKTITETVTQTSAPAYVLVSDATHAIASKLQGISVSTPAAPQTFSGAASPRVRSAPAATQSGNNAIMSTGDHQIWDRSVSVKEHLKHKLEPGEDERALNSQVTSHAVSPRKSTTPGDIGVVEKVREAVTSLLRNEDSPRSTATSSAKNSSLHMPISTRAHSAKSSPAQLLVSTSSQETAGEEENRGRILQAN
ncbi:hypothetical protein I3843_13G076300 [Carya illinoinensis]|uniref:Low-temperature-induced protein n=1 Tax=Carya illinoinensis TaxID=32201 RepID=A0A922DCQ2_CARIL|nr:hypothetical protein I3760_13G088300 [Carya illinoinensis]KAG6681343.1 hypothetical protein I3842_13G089000 [Carya illinoinensis]KAG7949688.1 hypothetical protein I3843_13G076300 [Carya illinoinensis]